MNISVFKPAGRKNYVCQWVDPVTGRKVTKSAGTNIKRDAERFAGNLQKELDNGTYHKDLRMTWEAFRDRFEQEYLSGSPESTADRYATVLNAVERHINPKLLASLNEATLSRFQAKCREAGNSEATIKTNVTHLLAALKWAVGMRLIPRVPEVRKPKNVSGMKGRKITGEEFDRMIQHIPAIAAKDPREWEFLLRGLWHSGLRLGEALNLHWTDDRNLCVDLESGLFIIQPHAQKKRQYTESPIAPEFLDMLEAIPGEQRDGFVFNPMGSRDRNQRLRVDTASRLISTIGESAGIKVSESPDGKKIKYASAHDLRRAFGFRWSRLIMPTELKELMRHAQIQTTMEFYVGTDARATARRLREVSANTLANTTPKATTPHDPETGEVPKNKGE